MSMAHSDALIRPGHAEGGLGTVQLPERRKFVTAEWTRQTHTVRHRPMSSRALTAIGILTWIVAGIPHLSLVLQKQEGIAAWLVFYLAFGVLFVASMRAASRRVALVFLAAQSVTALVLTWFEPAGYMAILLVIVAAELGADLSYRATLAGIGVQSAVMAFIVMASRDFDAPLTMVMAYLLFQIFAALTSHAATSESRARQELARANTELRVATELLGMQSRTAERLRIARDLHDLIGHHLTALSLNLEVASHQPTGAAQAIEKSRTLTKLMLADVRDVVSRMRENEPIDLTHALQSIKDVIPMPCVELTMPADLAVSDATVAQVALRSVQEIVTNAVRHANARHLWLDLGRRNGSLTIDARDDGHGVDVVRMGNGLRGLRERVESVHGAVEFQSEQGHGFQVHVKLPLPAEEIA
jgi:signal transduction histidine kinase